MSTDRRTSFNRKNSPYKERGPTVVIPNIPKVTDERARIKLLCDYDKYEPELFKHHIGTPETTCMIGLKHVPSDFDRHIPSSNEPTNAEREMEARRRRKYSQRHSSTAMHPISRFISRNAAASTTTTNNTNTTSLIKGAGTSADTQAAAAPSNTNTNAATLNTITGGGGGGVDSSQTSNMRASTQPSTTVPIPEHVLPPTIKNNNNNNSGRQQGFTRGGKAIETSELKTQEGVETSKGGITTEVQGTKRQSPIRSLQSKKRKLPLEKEEKEEMDNNTFRQLMQRSPSPKRIGITTSSNGSPTRSMSEKRDMILNADQCGQLLRVLVNTPPEYSESFRLDLRHIDLGWMRTGRYPSSLITLQTWRSSEGIIPQLNSPRSALVLLRNGVAIEDLIPREIRDDDPMLPNDCEARRLVKKMRLERTVKSKEGLLQDLRNEYLSLCRTVNLADVLKAFRSDKKKENDVILPTTIKGGQERQQKILETVKKRMEKQLAFAKDVRERELKAEERKRQVEEELKERIERKKEVEMLAQQRAAERLALQQQKAAEMEAFYQKQLQERLARAEEKSARRAEAQQRQIELRQAERLKLAEERQQRFARMTEIQEQQKLQVQQKYEEKEQKLQRTREEQERRRQEMHEKMLEKAAKSEALRELARQRAALHEESMRQAAVEQQRRVGERLREFQQRCEEGRGRRAQAEAARRQHLREVFSAATERLSAARAAAAARQEAHARQYAELRRARESEMLLRREKEREEMEAKAFAVLRSKRVTEFEKLEMVVQLLSKREAALLLERQKELLQQETRKNRDALIQERNMLKQQIASQRDIMQ